MKIVLAVGIVVVACIILEVIGRIIAKGACGRFDKMTPEERFRRQNDMRKIRLL